MFEIKKINLSINNRKILNDISFKTDSQTIGIIGKSGSGKSSLLKCISGTIFHSNDKITLEGEIYLNNKKIDNESYINNKIYYLEQNFLLIPTITIEQNLKIVDENADLKTLLDNLKLDINVLSKYPNELSGGEKQRIAIGQALLYNPDILLLDEPFSNLDVITTIEIRNFLKQILKQFKKIILITHDKNDLLELCDYAIVIDNGEIVTQNKPINLIFDSSKDLLKLNLFNNKFEYNKRIYNIHNLIFDKTENFLFEGKIINIILFEFYNKIIIETTDKQIVELVDKDKKFKINDCIYVSNSN
jgi:ABC-type multidrug transport system ATPase subunit